MTFEESIMITMEINLFNKNIMVISADIFIFNKPVVVVIILKNNLLNIFHDEIIHVSKNDFKEKKEKKTKYILSIVAIMEPNTFDFPNEK